MNCQRCGAECDRRGMQWRTFTTSSTGLLGNRLMSMDTDHQLLVCPDCSADCDTMSEFKAEASQKVFKVLIKIALVLGAVTVAAIFIPMLLAFAYLLTQQ